MAEQAEQVEQESSSEESSEEEYHSYIPEGFRPLPGTADVDRLCIDGCPLELLGRLLSGDLDLAAGLHFASTSDNLAAMGCPIVSDPRVVFVRSFGDRRAFHRELQAQDPFRYLPLSPNPNKFLDTPSPRRIRLELVLDALVRAHIEIVNFLSFGMKSHIDLYQFLDDFVPHASWNLYTNGYRLGWVPGRGEQSPSCWAVGRV